MRTRERVLLGVHETVVMFSVTGVSKPSATFRTLVPPLCRVGEHVHLEVVFSRVALAAVRTDVRPWVARVHLFVTQQVRWAVEALAAHFALVRPLLGVSQQVDIEVGAPRVVLLAYFAHVWPLSRVGEVVLV